MIRALLAAALFFCAPTVGSVRGDENVNKEDSEELRIRVLRPPLAMFRDEHLPKLPRTPSGEERSDAMPYIKKNMLPFAKEGTSAVWLPKRGALVVTATLGDQDALEQMFHDSDWVEIQTYQYTLSVWEYQAVAGNDEKPPYLLDTLKQIKDSGARVVHTHTLQARSGLPVSGLCGIRDPDKPEPPFGKDGDEGAGRKVNLRGTRGSSVYIEGVSGADRRMVDASLKYAIRIPSDRLKGDFEMTGETNVLMFAGKDVVVQLAQPPQIAPPPGQEMKVLKYAVVIRADAKGEPKAFEEGLDAQIKKEIMEELRWEKEMLKKAKGK